MPNGMFQNRKEAGLALADKLMHYKDTNSVVIAIPRGGVPVGFEIAKKLNLPLDIVLSKKIGHPLNKEFAIGAVSLDSSLLDEHPEVPNKYLEQEINRLKTLLKEKYDRYRGQSSPLSIEGKNVIIVDDGIATGNTLLVSIAMLRKKNPAKIIVAVPVLPFNTIKVIKDNSDEFIYLMAPKAFRGVGGFYEEFQQVEDQEVIQILGAPNHI